MTELRPITEDNFVQAFELKLAKGQEEFVSLTDEAIAYRQSRPEGNIDKELNMQHDEAVMDMICGFYEKHSAD